jgi:hypothetical protein
MKLTSVAAVAAVVLALAGASSSSAGSSTGPTASVENIATVMGAIVTNFEFRLYDCPAGEEMAVVEWEAEQPARSGIPVSSGTQPFGPSTGEQVQYLTLTAGGSFIAGEQWVGSGIVACGAVLIPVSGSGQTLSQTGV